MNEFNSIPRQRMDQIRCQECGHTCSRYDFMRGVSLCTHLALDALAAQKTRQTRQEDRRERFRHDSSASEESGGSGACLRCRGLMVREVFCDLEINAKFEGWRCLSCGYIRDRVIAHHEVTEIRGMAPQTSVRTTRAMALKSKSRKYSDKERR